MANTFFVRIDSLRYVDGELVAAYQLYNSQEDLEDNTECYDGEVIVPPTTRCAHASVLRAVKRLAVAEYLELMNG